MQASANCYSTEDSRLSGGLEDNLVAVFGASLELLTIKDKQGQAGFHLACLEMASR